MYTHTYFLFFFNDTATTEIYTLSLHDALPIYQYKLPVNTAWTPGDYTAVVTEPTKGSLESMVLREPFVGSRSEEHTSELQSLAYLVCRLLLEKKKQAHAVCGGSDLQYST